MITAGLEAAQQRYDFIFRSATCISCSKAVSIHSRSATSTCRSACGCHHSRSPSISPSTADRWPGALCPHRAGGFLVFLSDLWSRRPGQAVVFCPDEDEVAHLYTPDFEGFLYRAMLEVWLHGVDSSALRRATGAGCPGQFCRPSWRCARPAWHERCWLSVRVPGPRTTMAVLAAS